MNTQSARTVVLSCENFYIGGDMHSDERLLLQFFFVVITNGKVHLSIVFGSGKI